MATKSLIEQNDTEFAPLESVSVALVPATVVCSVTRFPEVPEILKSTKPNVWPAVKFTVSGRTVVVRLPYWATVVVVGYVYFRFANVSAPAPVLTKLKPDMSDKLGLLIVLADAFDTLNVQAPVNVTAVAVPCKLTGVAPVAVIVAPFKLTDVGFA